MFASGYLAGVGRHVKMKSGAASTVAGVVSVDETDGIQPGTTTDWADTMGLILDTTTHTTTPAVGAEGLLTVDTNPLLIVGALMSGGATNGTALTELINTAADATKLIVTDADVGTASMATGTLWCKKGANAGQSRILVTFNSATDVRATVAFYNAIAVGDIFHQCPWAIEVVGAGIGNVQATTTLDQADASIVAGTGGVAVVVGLDLEGVDGWGQGSRVHFILGDHILNNTTTV